MNRRVILAVMVIAAFAVLAVAPFIGMKVYSPVAVLTAGSGSLDADIFWRIRVPRVLVAFASGAALSVGGMAFQALFRNPLATPFTLGVSSGAAFGASVYVITGLAVSIAGLSGRTIGAFLGALFAIGLVYGLTRATRALSTSTMLLAGVAVSFFFSSLIMFIQYLSDFAESFRILHWLMGGFEVAGYRPVITILPFIVGGALVIFRYARELNLMTAGEDIAISRGVDAGRMRIVLFFIVSLMVGMVVSVAGPVGFVGMMAPHICRLVIGSDHRFLTPVSFLFGGAFLVFCDTLARVVIAPAEIPVGVVTALLGGPFFLWLLVTGAAERSFV